MEIYGSNKWTRFNRQQVIARSFPLLQCTRCGQSAIWTQEQKTMYTLKTKSTLVHLNVPYHFKAWFFPVAPFFFVVVDTMFVSLPKSHWIILPLMVKLIPQWIATTASESELIGYCRISYLLLSQNVPQIEIYLKSSNESDFCFLLLIGMIQSLSSKCAMCIELFRIILFAVCRSALHKCH